MLQQAPEGVHPAMSPSQASPGLSCLSRLTSRTRGGGPATERPSECPTSAPSCHCRGPSLRAGAPQTPRENPTLPLWNVCYWRDVPQGKQQLLTGDPGNLRERLMRRRKAGDQRDLPKVYLLVPLQGAEFAPRLFLALKAKVPTPLLS